MKSLFVYALTASLATGLAWAGDDKDHDKTKHSDGSKNSGSASTATTESTGGSDDMESTSSGSSTKSHQLIRLSDLMDAKIKSSDDEDLGSLEDLLVNPATGKIDFAVLGRGGFLGIGEKLVPVPWKAISVKSDRSFTVNVNKEKLRSAPTVDKEYSNIHDPTHTITIYRFFAVPADVGGSDLDDSTVNSEGKSDLDKEGKDVDDSDMNKPEGGSGQSDTNETSTGEATRTSTRPSSGPTSLRL